MCQDEKYNRLQTDLYIFDFLIDLDSMISQALLVGDYETAVDLCFHGNRVADAIVVAMAGSPLLLEKTQRRYFASSESKITRVKDLF